MVQTVFGAINDSDLGSVLSHEHVACFNPSMRMGFGEFWFNKEDVIEKAAAMFRQAKDECGVTTVVDATPLDLGRDIKILREVSIRSGIQIIASSGMYYNEEVFLIGKSPARFARFFINECENGIDGTTAKPGILKCATGNQGFTDTNVMLLSTMSIVQKETQLPLYAHNTHSNKTAYRQLELFEKNGVDLHKVIIGHCSDSSDIPYLEDILRCGCFLGFDRINLSAYQRQAQTIVELIRRGWENQLLVSHDYYAFIDFGNTDWETQHCQKSDRNFKIVHQKLFPELRDLGASDMQLGKLVRNNPRRVFEQT